MSGRKRKRAKEKAGAPGAAADAEEEQSHPKSAKLVESFEARLFTTGAPTCAISLVIEAIRSLVRIPFVAFAGAPGGEVVYGPTAVPVVRRQTLMRVLPGMTAEQMHTFGCCVPFDAPTVHWRDTIVRELGETVRCQVVAGGALMPLEFSTITVLNPPTAPPEEWLTPDAARLNNEMIAGMVADVYCRSTEKMSTPDLDANKRRYVKLHAVYAAIMTDPPLEQIKTATDFMLLRDVTYELYWAAEATTEIVQCVK